MHEGPIAILWRFRVHPDRISEFRQAYGPNGLWATLFRSAEGYLGTELLESQDAECSFITVDRWRRSADYTEFKGLYREAYEELDRRLADLTTAEEEIGIFRSENSSLSR